MPGISFSEILLLLIILAMLLGLMGLSLLAVWVVKGKR